MAVATETTLNINSNTCLLNSLGCIVNMLTIYEEFY